MSTFEAFKEARDSGNAVICIRAAAEFEKLHDLSTAVGIGKGTLISMSAEEIKPSKTQRTKILCAMDKL